MAVNDTTAQGQTSEARGPSYGANPPAHMGGQYHPRARLSERKRIQQIHLQNSKGEAAYGMAGEKIACSM